MIIQHVLKMQYISLFLIYSVQKNSMPKLHEEIGGTKTKIYCQSTICQTCPCSATDHQTSLTTVGK